MKNIIKTLILLNLALSFDSSFGYFTSNKKENFFKDYFSLSAITNGTENHFLSFVNGSQSASINFITGYLPWEDAYLRLEAIGTINKLLINFDAYSYDETSYVQGSQSNINLHWGQIMDSDISSFNLFLGFESSKFDIYLLNSWDSIFESYESSELSMGFSLIQDLNIGLYGTYLIGDNTLLDNIYEYEGWDLGIILPSLFTKNIAWQWSYKTLTYDESDFESNTTQLKMMMDL